MTTNEHLTDVMRHKQLVLFSAEILTKYLCENNREKEAVELANRCAVHDNSKLTEEEIKAFLKLKKEEKSMRKAEEQMPKDVIDVIKIHWKNNRHHPEYFDDYHEMTEIDIMEMACDWHARSKQFETSFLEFVKTRQRIRFKFDDEFFERVFDYCVILEEHDFSKG